MSWSLADVPDQHGRVAVVTGATGGLGAAIATALASRGAHVVLAARNTVTAEALRERITAVHPEAAPEVVELDLASLASVERAAGRIAAAHPRVDLLIDNAGVMAPPRGETADGFETQLGVNHLGHWALTARLLPALVAAPDARVVTVTSGAQHLGRPLDPADPFRLRHFSPWRAYGDSKLAARHFAQGLDRRFRAAGLPARALTAHPGLTDSGLQATTVDAGGAGRTGRFFLAATRLIGMTPQRGALTVLRAATDPGLAGGALVGPRWTSTGPPVPRKLVRPGTDAAVEVLWRVSRELTGLDVDPAAVAARSPA